MAGWLVRAAALALMLLAPPAGAQEAEGDAIAAGLAALDRQEYRAAAVAFTAAAEAGEADAMFYLGRMQELGLGTGVDLALAAQIFTLGTEAGSALAGNRLGLMYLNGEGVVQDYSYARELVCAAALLADSGPATRASWSAPRPRAGWRRPSSIAGCSGPTGAAVRATRRGRWRGTGWPPGRAMSGR